MQSQADPAPESEKTMAPRQKTKPVCSSAIVKGNGGAGLIKQRKIKRRTGADKNKDLPAKVRSMTENLQLPGPQVSRGQAGSTAPRRSL